MIKLCELQAESAIWITLKQKAKNIIITTSKLCSLEGNVLNLDKAIDRLIDKLEVSEIIN